MRRPDRVTQAVVAVSVLALLARLVGLGARPLHWDEARVGYWTLRSLAVGTYEYRPVAGGPFLYVVGRWLFSLFGPGDAVARLPVAIVGGLLPLVALLFRFDGKPSEPEAPSAGLDAAETVSLSVLLGFAPPLLYYSRVLRGDLPLAAFALVTVGLLYRAHTRENRPALYAGAAALGLTLTTSGFALALLGCWVAALVLVFDEGRVRGDPPGVLLARVRRVGRKLWSSTTPVLRAVLVTIAVALFFYIPRGVVDLTRPSTWLSALSSGSVGALNRFLAVRVLGRHAPPEHLNDHALLPFVADNAGVLLATALPVVALGLWGFLRERYGGRSRAVVSFGASWAGVGLLVFPMATEVNEPWVAVHVLVPMTLPAAVGLAALWGATRAALADGRAARVATALLLVSATGLHTGVVVADEVYDAPAPADDLPGYAQPDTELGPATTVVEAAIAGNDGVDVLFVGERFAVADESVLDRPPIPPNARDAFSERLPFAWYVERLDAETASVSSPDDAPETLPPVVVTAPRYTPALSDRVAAYDRYEVDLALTDRAVVVYVRE